MSSPSRGRRAVIGADFGTLSGRAVVVSVDDCTTHDIAAHEYAHGVQSETLPASERRLPHDWALQVPSDFLDATMSQPLAELNATLHHYFGRGENDVMHRLRAIQRKAVSG